MFDFKRKYLIMYAFIVCLLYLVFSHAPVHCRDPQSATIPPTLSGNASEEFSQHNELDDFLTRFNGCAWQKTPGHPSRDIYIELKDRTLIFYEYPKDQYYCFLTSSPCFAQTELWRIDVAGYNTSWTDRHGNLYHIVISRNGETIALYGMDNNIGRKYIMDIFVRYFCSEKH